MRKKSLIEGLELRETKSSDSQLLARTKKLTTTKSFKSSGVQGKIDTIKIAVNKYLGKYKDIVEVVRDNNRLNQYISTAIENGIIAIDTETTGLNPMQDIIIGLCLYTPNEKAIYVPLKHKSYITNSYLANQIEYSFITTQLERLKGVKVIMHNGKFDKRMIKHNFNVDLGVYWDTLLCAKCLNNTEPAALKWQYADKIEEHKKEYDFSKLFTVEEYPLVPVETAALYAAIDAYATYKLYDWQRVEIEKFIGVKNVFLNIEMPLIEVVSDMEDTGVAFDAAYAKELSVKYHKLLDEAYEAVRKELIPYNKQIKAFADSGKKIDYPINVTSPTQLAVLFYDILKIPAVDKKMPRGTGSGILANINLPICKAILEVRKYEKLLGTYIDKLPEVIDSNTHRIHARFNQYGADTGRFSSDNPNLQNIPSHNDDIRKMFIATPGYYIGSFDYSKQEPFILAEFSQDKKFIDSFNSGKDIYANIASVAYKVPYDQCLEFNPDGTTNKKGKERRGNAKSILLGVMYCRGANSVAEQIHSTNKEAQKIIDDFYSGYPQMKKWMDKTVEDAKKNGYVETLAGRRRYLKDISTPEYEYSYISERPQDFNPLMFKEDCLSVCDVSDNEKLYYTEKLRKAFKFTDKMAIKEEAKTAGISIRDNEMKVADAVRQCVNSRIQGSAADMTKTSMINLYNNKRLQELGFKLLICVHDEVIGECPKENAKEAFDIVKKIMVASAQQFIHFAVKCDGTITDKWYGEEVLL